MNLNSPITGDIELDAYLFAIRNSIEDVEYALNQRKLTGFSGTFPTNDGRTVTVVQGIIVSVE